GASAERLRSRRIPVLELNDTGDLPLYVDGADEFTAHRALIKGGGGALTREKIVAGASRRFVCIVDQSKRVDWLGRFPLPVEVIPMARSFVARQLTRLGGQPELRSGVTTDNGNVILDVHNLEIMEPIEIERRINDIPGVVCNGIFALRPADEILIAGPDGIERIR
ncbi:MAG: ribose-5-phosphate isomerase RpiA, partial [Halofilum sp. (in: g-proteobacteria)]